MSATNSVQEIIADKTTWTIEIRNEAIIIYLSIFCKHFFRLQIKKRTHRIVSVFGMYKT